MAINRFQNKDILVTSKVPIDNVKTFALSDASNLRSLNHQIAMNELQADCTLEAHIYSADLLVNSKHHQQIFYLLLHYSN